MNMETGAMAITCWHCEPDRKVRRELDPDDRCDRCFGKYTPSRVKALLALRRRFQDHGIQGQDDGALAAEVAHVNEILLALGRSGKIKEPALSALVNHVMLGQYQSDVAAACGVARETIRDATKRGLEILCDALNR